MSDRVYLDYTQAELDRNYDQRGWIGVANAEVAIARYQANSQKARDTLICYRDIAYGATDDEMLDWFPTARAGAPVMIFVHGGPWRNFTKDDNEYLAPTFVNAGARPRIRDCFLDEAGAWG